MKQVTAIFKHGDDAKRAMDALVESSFPPDDISILRVVKQKIEGVESHTVEDVPIGQKTATSITLPTGIAVGATVGAALTLNGLLPGLGLVAAGPILGALEGMAIGGAAGSLLGILGGLGWWKADADIPADDVAGGGLLVGISVPDGRVHEAVKALQDVGAVKVTVA